MHLQIVSSKLTWFALDLLNLIRKDCFLFDGKYGV